MVALSPPNPSVSLMVTLSVRAPVLSAERILNGFNINPIKTQLTSQTIIQRIPKGDLGIIPTGGFLCEGK